MNAAKKGLNRLQRRIEAFDNGKFPSSMQYHRPGSTKKNAARGGGPVDGKERSRAATR